MDELDLLEQYCVFVDGTFTLIKDLDFTQIYIVSVLIKYENRTFSYPVALSLMRGRTADAYREFFGHLAQIFEQKNHRSLNIPKILSDAESAIFRPINEIFPHTNLKLCKVHLLRNWRKKMIECFGQVKFLTDQNLVNFWLLLRGIFFIPSIFLDKILDFFIENFRPKLPKRKFDEFLKYLKKNYCTSDSKYPPSMWSFYSQISDFSDMETSTNSIERINRQLKEKCPNGMINFHKCCKIIWDFKTAYLAQKIRIDADPSNMNLKRQRQIENENSIKNLVKSYTELPFDCQSDIKFIVNFMYKFAHYNEDTLFFQNDQVSNSDPTLPNVDSESDQETDPEDIPMSSLLFRTDI